MIGEIFRFFSTNTLQYLAFHLLLSRIFDPKKYHKNWFSLAYLLALFTLCYSFFNGYSSPDNFIVISSLLMILLSVFLYEGAMFNKIFVVLTLNAIYICWEMIGIIIIHAIFWFLPLQTVISINMYSLSIIQFISIKLYDSYITKNKDIEQLHQPKSHLIIIPLTSLMFLLILWDMKSILQAPYLGHILIIIAIITNFNIYYLINYRIIIQRMNSYRDNAIANEQIKYYTSLYNMLKTEQEEVLTLKHNIKYDLLSIKKAIEDGNNIQALKEIEEKLTITHNMNNFTCNIPIIDAIINYKLYEINEYNKKYTNPITLDVKVVINGTLTINTTHLTNILGNLLDNSIEACKENFHNKHIDLTIMSRQNSLYISVLNGIETPIKFKKGLPLSSKRTNKHGIGLSTVKSFTKIYNGIFDIKVKNNIFHVELILFNCIKNLQD